MYPQVGSRRFVGFGVMSRFAFVQLNDHFGCYSRGGSSPLSFTYNRSSAVESLLAVHDAHHGVVTDLPEVIVDGRPS
jgi:hypothetical protein